MSLLLGTSVEHLAVFESSLVLFSATMRNFSVFDFLVRFEIFTSESCKSQRIIVNELIMDFI